MRLKEFIYIRVYIYIYSYIFNYIIDVILFLFIHKAGILPTLINIALNN